MKVRNVVTGIAVLALIAELALIAAVPEPPDPPNGPTRELKSNRLRIKSQHVRPLELRQIQRRPFNPDPQPWHALG